MSIAAAVLIVAVGAILKFAVSDSINGIDLQTIGVILMVAGVVGLIISLFVEYGGRRRGDGYVEEREVREVRDRGPRDGY